MGCTGRPAQPAIAYAEGCARPIEATLARDLGQDGPPIPVLIDFDSASVPALPSWGALGLASCTGTLCEGIVTRSRLLRFCADARVRDIERWR